MLTEEPRIAERRRDVITRRRLRIWITAGAVVVVVALGWGFTQSSFLDVDEVRVIGAQRTGPQAVIEAAGIELGTPLLGLDLEAPRSAVAALPWVDLVRSSKTWGGIITLDVSERTAVAQVFVNNRWALVDVHGRVLAVVASKQQLPVVAVSNVAKPGGWLAPEAIPLVEASQALMPLAGTEIGAISWQDDQVVVALPADRQVLWGGSENTQAKAIALATFLEKVDSNCYEQIDLSVPEFPVLTSNNICP